MQYNRTGFYFLLPQVSLWPLVIVDERHCVYLLSDISLLPYFYHLCHIIFSPPGSPPHLSSHLSVGWINSVP